MTPMRGVALGILALGVVLLVVGFIVDTFLLGYVFWLCFFAGVALLVVANVHDSKHSRHMD